MPVIAYGIPADYTDEYPHIHEDTIIKSVRLLAKTIIWVFGSDYLRSPSEENNIRLMAMNEKRDWLDMLENIDCMHWKWKNCPKEWHDLYCGKSLDPTIVLEAVASHNLWIWHYFFWGCRDLSITSISCIDPIYLANLQVEKLLLATTK
jgi:hypothetical protein